MIERDFLIASVKHATSEVFSLMLGMEVEFDGIAVPARTGEPGIIALVGITGEWGGSGVFCCSPALASLACSRMLGEDPHPAPSITDEVLDVVAEITNMMIGNFKDAMEPVTGPLAISVPTVIHGRNFEFRNPSAVHSLALVFRTERESFEVRISLAPTPEKSGGHARVPVLGLAHL